jgi:hypothetical protein
MSEAIAQRNWLGCTVVACIVMIRVVTALR